MLLVDWKFGQRSGDIGQKAWRDGNWKVLEYLNIPLNDDEASNNSSLFSFRTYATIVSSVMFWVFPLGKILTLCTSAN
jgi:hypothetical protein